MTVSSAGQISVDLGAVAERQRSRLGDALYDVDALSVALEDLRAENESLRAEVESLKAQLAGRDVSPTVVAGRVEG